MEDLKLWLVLSQLLNFWIIFFVFKYYLGEKIVKILEERKRKIEASDNAEEEAKATLEEAEKETEELLTIARQKAQEIEANAEELAKQNTKKTLEKAEKETEFMVNSAREQIGKEQLEMENSMKDNILGLALKLNAKIFKKDSVNKDFIESEYELLTK